MWCNNDNVVADTIQAYAQITNAGTAFKFNKEQVITSDRYMNLLKNVLPYYKHEYAFMSGIWRGEFINVWNGTSEVLVLGHSDCESNNITFNILKTKSKGILKKIFAINGNSKNDNIIPIPLGITNDCDDSSIHRIYGNLEIMEQVSQTHIDKRNLLYLNINIQTYPLEREMVVDMFKNKKFVTWIKEQQPTLIGRQKFLEDIKAHDFVLCPRGNGIDTHRLWETLYMGSIPIVIYSDVHKNLLDLPILFVNNWNEISYDFLLEQLSTIKSKTWNMEKLNISYWINLMVK